MMDSVCRTCLCIIRNGCVIDPVHQLQPNGEINDRHKLEACVPELSVDIVLEPIICKTCRERLALAFQFKTMCLETEKTLYNYIQQRRQSENCTNLLNSCDLLALVRNDIILEHSYSSIGKHSETTVHIEKPDCGGDTLDEPEILRNNEHSSDAERKDKRILRPRIKIKCDINSNKLDNGERVLRRKRVIALRRPKSFICKPCNKSFAQQRQLAVHERTHRTKPFTRNSRLSRHVEEKHRCDGCNNSFTDFVSYKRHVREYSGKCVVPARRLAEKRRTKRLKYFCKVCKRGFTTSFSRNRHVQYQHVDE